MKKIIFLLFFSFLYTNNSFATNYEKYLIKKRDETKYIVFNMIVSDWNKYISGIYSEGKCNIDADFDYFMNLADCAYNRIKKHMRRNSLILDDQFNDEQYDAYIRLFNKGKDLGRDWYDLSLSKNELKRRMEAWTKDFDKTYEEINIYYKEYFTKLALAENFKLTKKDDTDKKTSQSGSGFFINTQGHFITNHHVVDGCKQSKINFNDKEINAKLIATDKSLDLALLKTEIRPKAYLNLSNTSPEKLQKIFVAGYPFGKGLSDDLKFTNGIISSVKGFNDNSNQIQIDAAINPGNSGGPIVDEEGTLVAVAVSGMNKEVSEGIGFGIKTSSVKSFLNVNKIKYTSSGIFNFSLNTNKLNDLLEKSTVYTYCN